MLVLFRGSVRGIALLLVLLAAPSLMVAQAGMQTAEHPASAELASPAKAARTSIPSVDYLRALPLLFERNDGQASSDTRFLARTPSYRASFAPDGVAFHFPSSARRSQADLHSAVLPVLRLKFSGAEKHVAISGQDRAPGRVNYYCGRRPDDWHTNIPLFARLRYADIYPGIDLLFYGNPTRLESDFVVAAGADASKIRMKFEGAEGVRVDEAGELVVRHADNEVRFRKPVLYQTSASGRQSITGGYELSADGSVGFWTGRYDRKRPLVIDPVLVYASEYPGTISGMAVDRDGNVFITGQSNGDEPTYKNPYRGPATGPGSPTQGPTDLYVAKLSPDGKSLLYTTHLEAGYPDEPAGLALDPEGNAYIVGTTSTRNFPATAVLRPDTALEGGAYAAKLSPSGQLIYATLTGGGTSVGRAIAVDRSGSAYLTGSAGQNTDIPLVNAYKSAVGGAFVQKLDPTGTHFLFSTFLGNDLAMGTAIGVDATFHVYVAGQAGENFPTKNPVQFKDGTIFLTKFTPEGNDVVYSTLLGRGTVYALAVDSAGNAYIAGKSRADLPSTLNSFQTAPASSTGCASYDPYCPDPLAFVLAMNSEGTGLLYSTFLGEGTATSLVLDSSGHTYIAGTWSKPSSGSPSNSDFPLIHPIQKTLYGMDGFVVELDNTGKPVLSTPVSSYAYYYEGRPHIAVDDARNIYFASNAEEFPIRNPAQSEGGYLIAKISHSSGGALALSNSQRVSFLRNLGDSPAQVSEVTISPKDVFYTGGDCLPRVRLEPGTECMLLLSRWPLTPATVTVTSDAMGSPNTFTVRPIENRSMDTLFYQPSALHFPPQMVGVPGAPQTLTIRNTLGHRVSIKSVKAVSPDFLVTHDCAELESDRSCSATVTNIPSEGTRDTTLNVNYTVPDITGAQGMVLTDHVWLHALPTTNTVLVSGTEYSFGGQYIGAPGLPRTVTLTNVAPAPVGVGMTLSGPFTMRNGCPDSLPSGESCRIEIVFVPVAKGTVAGNLRIDFSGSGSPANVKLSGSGEFFSDLKVSPSSAGISASVGESRSSQLTLTNGSSTGLAITTFELSDPQFSQTSDCPLSPSLLAANASCTVTITFTPSLTGTQAGTLVVRHTGGGDTLRIPLTGEGYGRLFLHFEPLDFGTQTVGTTSSPVRGDVSSSNSTTATYTLSATGDFRILHNPCSPIEPRQLCSLDVVFSPTAAGLRTGTLTLTSPVLPNPQIINLTGVGGPHTVLSTDTVNYGVQSVGTSSSAQTVTLTNKSDHPVSITGAQASAGFAQTNDCPAVLAAGTSCSISIKFAPISSGTQNGVLSVSTDVDGSQSVRLWGIASGLSVTTASSTSASIRAGETASFQLQLTAAYGFSGPVSLSCEGVPAKATCSVSPASLTISGTAPVGVVVNISTAAESRALLHPLSRGTRFLAALSPCSLPLLFAIFPGGVAGRKRFWLVLAGALVVLVCLAACGGGGSSPVVPPPGPPPITVVPGTPAGTYNVKVIATSGGLAGSASLSLTVR